MLNEDLCRRNIHSMALKAANNNVLFRPHFKTHQSAEIAGWFRDEGVTAITVSSVSMASYFARHGWKDITIAFPVNILENNEINQLAAIVNLNLLIESVKTATFLSEKLTVACGFFIKIDTGYHRAGIDPFNISLIEQVLFAAKSPCLQFRGFLTHSGQVYHARGLKELKHIHQQATESLLVLKKEFRCQFPDLIVSTGDTPTCSQINSFEGIDEIRPGNFVFYDVMQFTLGSCALQEIAVAVVCPVVAVYTERKQVVIYGGAVHFSKEHILLAEDANPSFGIAVGWDGSNWKITDKLGVILSFSQEHGVVSLTQAGCELKPGDLIAILPVHACLTAHLMREYTKLQGRIIATMSSEGNIYKSQASFHQDY